MPVSVIFCCYSLISSWILFPREDFVNLYPEYGDTLDPVFKVDLSHPDIKKFPLLSLTQPMECYLKQGRCLNYYISRPVECFCKQADYYYTALQYYIDLQEV